MDGVTYKQRVRLKGSVLTGKAGGTTTKGFCVVHWDDGTKGIVALADLDAA